MKKIYLSVLILMLLGTATFLGHKNLPVVYGSDNSQTIPTRTPTPPPPTATSPGGGGNNPPPTHTSTPEILPTATATATQVPVNIAPTPVGGFLATAVPCGSSPTLQALSASNVRSGPGLEYAVIGQLVFLEVRVIVGRAETAEWWLVQLIDGSLGWVANDVVTVQGYTPVVPLVEAPALNGNPPPSGPVWNPTPPPFCTVTPTTAPPTNTATAVSTEAAEIAEAASTATRSPTEPPATEARPTSTPIVQATAVPLPPTPVPVASNPTEESDGRNIGLGLMAVGAAITFGMGIYFFTRTRRG